MKHQDIKITKLEIEEFLKEEVANITIKLLVDTNSHYFDILTPYFIVGHPTVDSASEAFLEIF